MKLLNVAVALSLLLPAMARGDGAYLSYWPEDATWKLSAEQRQLCAINYRNGQERMVLGIGVPRLEADKSPRGVWVFPVPARPAQVRLDVMPVFPRFTFQPLDMTLRREALQAWRLVRSSQVHPYLAILMFDLSPLGLIGGDASSLPDLQVHEQVQREGLVTQVVTAKDGEALSKYLATKGATPPPELAAAADGYIGKDYSFVVTWVEHASADEDRLLGVQVDFPTEDLFFPLRLTAAYGEQTIPATVYVIGAATPRASVRLAPYMQTDYARDPRPSSSGLFYGEAPSEPVLFTRVSIAAPSSAFENDLWLERTAPAKVHLADLALSWGVAGAWLGFLMLSVLVALLTRRLVAPDLPAKHAVLLGLANIAGIAGVAFVALLSGLIDSARPTGKLLTIVAGILGIVLGLAMLLTLVPARPGVEPGSWAEGIPTGLVFLSGLVVPPTVVWGWFSRRRAAAWAIVFCALFSALAFGGERLHLFALGSVSFTEGSLLPPGGLRLDQVGKPGLL